MVRAARAHLASRYAKGAAELMWSEYHRPLPDLDAVRAVIEAVRAPGPDVPQTMDLGAALVAMAAARLDIDRLEAELVDAVRQAGLD
jgi:hypothetical protein